MNERTPPEDFVRRLKALCGSEWDVRWNSEVHRWEFLSLSAGGVRVSQFLGWFTNPFTGERIEPDPVTGLLPFRDLTPDCQEEVLRNLEVSYIGNPVDGGTWRQYLTQRRVFNRDLRVQRAKERGATYADLIREVAISRPGWKKDHPRNQGPKVYGGVASTVDIRSEAAAPKPVSPLVVVSAFTPRKSVSF